MHRRNAKQRKAHREQERARRARMTVEQRHRRNAVERERYARRHDGTVTAGAAARAGAFDMRSKAYGKLRPENLAFLIAGGWLRVA